MAQNLKGIATIAAVDCDGSKNQALCSRYNIEGFPTLKLFGSDRQKNPYAAGYVKDAVPYNGPRTAKVTCMIHRT